MLGPPTPELKNGRLDFVNEPSVFFRSTVQAASTFLSRDQPVG